MNINEPRVGETRIETKSVSAREQQSASQKPFERDDRSVQERKEASTFRTREKYRRGNLARRLPIRKWIDAAWRSAIPSSKFPRRYSRRTIARETSIFGARGNAPPRARLIFPVESRTRRRTPRVDLRARTRSPKVVEKKELMPCARARTVVPVKLIIATSATTVN